MAFWKHVQLLGLTLLILVGLEGVASACACCDRSSWQRVSGWDAEGNALVDALENPGCSPMRRLEVWRPDQTSPSECIDLGKSGGQVVDCEDAAGWPKTAGLHWSSRRAQFSGPVRILKVTDSSTALRRAVICLQEMPWSSSGRSALLGALRRLGLVQVAKAHEASAISAGAER